MANTVEDSSTKPTQKNTVPFEIQFYTKLVKALSKDGLIN